MLLPQRSLPRGAGGGIVYRNFVQRFVDFLKPLSYDRLEFRSWASTECTVYPITVLCSGVSEVDNHVSPPGSKEQI